MKDSYQKYQDDNIEVKGYIDKNKILQYISEEQIYEYVLGFLPKEFDYICSPLRIDNNPGAFFQRGLYSDKLLFIDYADPSCTHNDCFSFIQRYYNLTDFYETLKFIQQNIIEKNGFKKGFIQKETKQKTQKKPAEIRIETRPFNYTDGLFWSRFGISRENLIKDKVFAVQRIFLKNGRKGDRNIPVYTKCYAFTNFKDNRKKLYFPYKKGKYRFLSTCTRNDVNIDEISKDTNQLVISKSYKDNRVLKNLKVNSIWFQNEGAFPDNLQDIVKDFEDVVVFFDNDNPGIAAAEKLVTLINDYSNKARMVYLDKELLSQGIKDPADLYSKKGIDYLTEFLLNNNIRYETNRHNSQ